MHRFVAHNASMISTLRSMWSPDFPSRDTPDGTRRQLLAMAPMAAAWGLSGGAAHAADTSNVASSALAPIDEGFVAFANAREKFEALFRFERDLRDEGTALSTYQFLVYAVPDGARPQPIVRFEGMEFSYFRRVAESTWRIHAHNVSYPRDLNTGQYTTTALNPYTGESLEVKPMKLLEDPGVLHSPAGYLPLDAKSVKWLDTYLTLRVEGELIKAEHIRPTPDGWPVQFIESSCSSVPRRDFNDPRVTSLLFQTAGFYVFPFPAWMRMGDRPGHMIGAWNGRKIPAAAALPRMFQERLRREDPELLEPRWNEFKTPISAALAAAV